MKRSGLILCFNISHASAFHQAHGQNDLFLLHFLIPELGQDHVRGQNTLLVGVLVYGGEAGDGQLGQVVVVKAHDGFIPGHGYAPLAEARHDTRGKNIGGSKDAGDLRLFGFVAR